MLFADTVDRSRLGLQRIGIGVLILVLLTTLLSLVRADVTWAGSPVSPGPGWKDHNYANSGGTATRPSEDKPQSKVWYTDGTWWGVLFDDVSTEHHIHRLSTDHKDWTDTGTAVDIRDHSQGDYLWEESTQTLYVASSDDPDSGGPTQIFKFTYNNGPDSYSLDPDFPVSAGSGPTESVAIAKDSTGQLWVTYTKPNGADPTKRDIMLNRTNDGNPANDHQWGTAFSVPGSAAASGDDISAIIAYGAPGIGVMWSDQLTSSFYFARHPDGSPDASGWNTQVVLNGTSTADDHINLKLNPTNPVNVLAAVKANPTGDILLLAGVPGSTWASWVVNGGGVSATRPQLVVDATNASVYVLYTWDTSCKPPIAPGCGSEDGGKIHYKAAPLASLTLGAQPFAGGPGTALINSSADPFINDLSTTKQSLTSTTGLLAIATDPPPGDKDYFHGWLPLSAPPPPPPPPTACSDLIDNDGDGLVDLFDPGCTDSSDNDEFNAPPPPPPGGHPFTDISGHLFEQDIIWLYNAGITAGCTSNRFCPDNVVNREQMASFLVRALGLPPTSQDFFTDDETSIHESDINRLAASGIAFGCGGGRYCPLQAVNREQMASFLVRGYAFGPTGTDFFTDDETSIHESDINRLAASGTTTGCSATRYCPLDPVTRGQMAAFIHRAET